MLRELKLHKFNITDGLLKIEQHSFPHPEQLDHATEIVEKARIDLKR